MQHLRCTVSAARSSRSAALVETKSAADSLAESICSPLTNRDAPLGRRFALAAVIATLLLAIDLAKAGHGRLDVALTATALDFRVVYCGAEALRTGKDPYTVEPLRSCEHRVGREPGEPEWAVTPLPLPGYAIALFVPLSLLPFVAAKALWVWLLVLGFALASACIAATARAPTLAVAAVFAPTIGFGINLHYGEPVPLAIAALCAAALALERKAYRSAAALTVVASIEPHVALPAILALGLLVPRARLPLAVALPAAGALSLATLGFARNLEYFTTLLPLHAQSELLARDQLGLSRFLALAGMPARSSLLLGTLCYSATTAFGIVAARRLSARLALPGLIVLFPPAAAMLGGTFVHDVQIAAALPAAVLLAPYVRTARVAIALLVVDWTASWRDQVFPALVGTLGAAVVAFPVQRRRWITWAGEATLFTMLLLAALARVPDRQVGVDSVRAQAAAIAPPGAIERLTPHDPASRAWALRIAVEPGWKEITLGDVVDKAPLWIALVLLIAAAGTGERRRAAA